MKKFATLISLIFLCMILFSNLEDAIGSWQNEKPYGKTQQKEGEKDYDLSTILVKFKDKVSKKQRNDAAILVRGKFKDKNKDGIDDRYKHIMGGRLALIKLKGEKGKDLASNALRSLQNHPFIEYAEYNYLQYIDLTPNDSLFSDLWGLHNTGQLGGTFDADIDAPEGWDLSTGDPEIVVGVIDTGIDYNHEDLAANIWINPSEVPNNGIDDDGNGYVDDVHGINAITGSGDPMDDHYHGTHCAGTIGAVGNNSIGVAGVAWAAKIIGIKFLNSSGSGTTADAITGINYAVALNNRGVNIRVLSNSWGGGSFSQALKDAISAANDVGILFVAAAGNDSFNNDVYPHYPSSYDLSNILAIASTDRDDNLSSFSNYGAISVDLAAPGSSILSTVPNNGYDTLSGTSMATPHVSGAAALSLSLNDGLTVDQLKNLLMDNGDSINELIGKCVSGNRLNIYNSLDQLPPPSPTFRPSADPITPTINQGQAASYTVGIESILGFEGNVDLSAVSNPEISATITFTPDTGIPSFSSTMEVVTNSSTNPDDYIITITGVDDSITKSTTVTLDVNPEYSETVSYTDSPELLIPDNDSTGITSMINVSDSLQIWEVTCEVNISHTWIGDLIVKLISPDGTETILHNREGGSADNIHKTYFATEFENENSYGSWTLFVSDNAGLDLGSLDSWSLTIIGPPDGAVDRPPTVTITAPNDGASFFVEEEITFMATADDFEDGDISNNIQWTSSKEDNLSSGASITTTLGVGEHTITASVTDSGGNYSEDSIMVTINPILENYPPIAGFEYVEIRGRVTFTDISTDDGTIVSRKWDFGDGHSKTTTALTVKHNYRRSGTYVVTLTVTDDSGETDSTTMNVMVSR
jgi:subtilisin family serine protease